MDQIKEYTVEWVISSLTMRYEGEGKVMGYSVSDVKGRAIRKISNDMCVPASLIEITDIREV